MLFEYNLSTARDLPAATSISPDITAAYNTV